MPERVRGPRRGLRLAIFAIGVGLVPVPFYIGAGGFAPFLHQLEICLLIGAAVAAESIGQISRLFLVLAALQLAAQLVVFAAAAWSVERLLRGTSDAVARGGVALAGAGLLVLGLAIPIYEAPFSQVSVDTNLAGVYRWPDLDPVPQPEPVPFVPPSEPAERAPCLNRDPRRQAFFGDTHVHTALSFDSVGQGTRNRPSDAYRFARGEPVGIQPYDRDGRPSRMVSLSRPLDFAVVTDHAELLGETHICQVPGSPGYDGVICRLVRGWTRLGYAVVNGDTFSRSPPTRYAFCGEGGRDCVAAAEPPWAEIQRAAEEAYDRTAACSFTSFVGFEWTGMPGGFNAHRNVVFRNEVVPARPINYIDTPSEEGLWDALERECIGREGACDAFAIPHNSNVSSGALFRIETADGLPIDASGARRRSRLEPLVEVTQHKGDSECRLPSGPTADEFCAFETPPGATMTQMLSGLQAEDPRPLSFAREVLAEGVLQQAGIGANPFRFGLVGSTDTHYGTPGWVEERGFLGHAAGIVSRLVEEPRMPDLPMLNPGGLAVVWAEENSRDSLFDAMRRRETYGTSGPRMRVRFFGGWHLPGDLCARSDFVERADDAGVPMGGELSDAPGAAMGGGPPDDARGGRGPRFAIRAQKDVGTPEAPGTDLQRIQIVKVWSQEGEPREQVFDVVVEGTPDVGVDLETCEPLGRGADELCAVWDDPAFDPATPAAWYVRVLENPSCRWNQWVCVQQGVDCRDPASVPSDLELCCDDAVPRSIQERAWTSPIWYTPGS